MTTIAVAARFIGHESVIQSRDQSSADHLSVIGRFSFKTITISNA